MVSNFLYAQIEKKRKIIYCNMHRGLSERNTITQSQHIAAVWVTADLGILIGSVPAVVGLTEFCGVYFKGYTLNTVLSF